MQLILITQNEYILSGSIPMCQLTVREKRFFFNPGPNPERIQNISYHHKKHEGVS